MLAAFALAAPFAGTASAATPVTLEDRVAALEMRVADLQAANLMLTVQVQKRFSAFELNEISWRLANQVRLEAIETKARSLKGVVFNEVFPLLTTHTTTIRKLWLWKVITGARIVRLGNRISGYPRSGKP